MAKKVKRKSEEEGEPAFEFPTFDERGYLQHEYEQLYATVTAFVIGVLVGGFAFLVGALNLPYFVPLAVGFGGTVGGAFAIRQIRPASSDYTKGDWATLIVLIFFGFLGIWFLLSDVAGALH